MSSLVRVHDLLNDIIVAVEIPVTERSRFNHPRCNSMLGNVS